MKNSQRLFEPNTRPFVFFLIVFAVATLVTKNFYLAAAEGVVILALIIYSLIMRSRRRKALLAYIESVTYDAETAKNNTLLNFPLPIVVFRLDDSRIIWGNEMFFSISGLSGTRTDISLAELIPEFSGKWLMEGKTQSPDLLSLTAKVSDLRQHRPLRRKRCKRSAFYGDSLLDRRYGVRKYPRRA